MALLPFYRMARGRHYIMEMRLQHGRLTFK